MEPGSIYSIVISTKFYEVIHFLAPSAAFFFCFQGPKGMSCARRLGCTALLFWKERMLRADNTTVIVLALQEREGPPIPMHRDEIVVDMATGIDHVPYPGTTYNTCEVPKVSAVALLRPPFVMFH